MIFLYNSIIYISFAVLLGIFLITGTALILFLKTYNKKVEFYENINGNNYQRVLSTRARSIRVGKGGEEILKTLKKGMILPADGKKMGNKTYWFAKGEDGYWYNVTLGDLDTKRNMLDIEPVDRDMRMFHVAISRMSNDRYNKQKWFEKYSAHILLFIFLAFLILGMWFIINRIGHAVEPLAQNQKMALELTKSQLQLTKQMNIIMSRLNIKGGSGIVPVGG